MGVAAITAVASVVAVTSLVLSACGSSSKSSSTPTTSSSGATSSGGTASSGGSPSTSATGAAAGAQPTGTPFKVGYIAESNSAQASATTGVQPSAQAWVDYENAHGGINGHPVQLDVQLEPSNPGVALADVQKLVSDGVIAIIDSDGGDDASWTSYIVSKNIPVYATGFNSPGMTVSSDKFLARHFRSSISTSSSSSPR